jgi:hypothetical protein
MHFSETYTYKTSELNRLLGTIMIHIYEDVYTVHRNQLYPYKQTNNQTKNKYIQKVHLVGLFI